MSGTTKGGKKAAATSRKRFGKDYYVRIGALGGKAETTKPKGFAANNELARWAGRVGGAISKRTPRAK